MNRTTERFVNTGHWLAYLSATDQYHQRARALVATDPRRYITTEGILLEVADALAGVRTRARAVTFLRQVHSAPDVEVVPLTEELLARATDLYAARPDKEWGLTDCVSFVVMQDRGLTEALAADHHFVQAGFRALLLE